MKSNSFLNYRIKNYFFFFWILFFFFTTNLCYFYITVRSFMYFLEAIYILKHGPITEMPPFKIIRRSKQPYFKCIILGVDIPLNIHLHCYSFYLEMSHYCLCTGQKWSVERLNNLHKVPQFWGGCLRNRNCDDKPRGFLPTSRWLWLHTKLFTSY